MKKLFGLIPAVFAVLLVTLFLILPRPAQAADVRTGQNIIISSDQKSLKDLYLFGGLVQLNAPVKNDVVAAGGTVNITGNVSNSVTAAGGNVTVKGKVGNTVRVAGGNIIIDRPVENDLVVAGGNITISKNSSVGGDLLVAGGQVNVEGPVHGRILMSGGTITLNSSVGGSVIAGRVGTLTLGPQAKIKGDLTYSSTQPAQKQPGSRVNGKISYQHVENQTNQQQKFAQAAFGASLYKLAVIIILSILLITFFKRGILSVIDGMYNSPWKSGGIGLIYLILTPFVSAILLILIWLGIMSFLIYAVLLILSIFLTNIFVGQWLMQWWSRRQKQPYTLDWKAGVVGPIVLAVIMLIPVIGWLFSAIIYVVALGALLGVLTGVLPQLQDTAKKK